jgi:hypothetical protein
MGSRGETLRMKIGAVSSAKKPKTNAERVSYIAGDYIATSDEQKPPKSNGRVRLDHRDVAAHLRTDPSHGYCAPSSVARNAAAQRGLAVC